MRKSSYLLFAGALLVAFSACKKNSAQTSAVTEEQSADSPKESLKKTLATKVLLFESPFTGSSQIVQKNANDPQTDIITGSNVSPFPWNGSYGSKFTIYYQNGAPADRKAYISTDAGRNILQFSISNPAIPEAGLNPVPSKGRVQGQLFDFVNNGANLKEFYQKVSVKLHYTSFTNVLNSTAFTGSGNEDFVTLFELFNGIALPFVSMPDYSKGYRVSIGLKKVGNQFNLIATGEKHAETGGDWLQSSAINFEYPNTFAITPGKWYTYEIYLKEGKATGDKKGAFWLKITDETNSANSITLGSFTAAQNTQSNNDASDNGFNIIFPMKLYASGNVIQKANPSTTSPSPLQVYFADYKLYDHY